MSIDAMDALASDGASWGDFVVVMDTPASTGGQSRIYWAAFGESAWRATPPVTGTAQELAGRLRADPSLAVADLAVVALVGDGARFVAKELAEARVRAGAPDPVPLELRGPDRPSAVGLVQRAWDALPPWTTPH